MNRLSLNWRSRVRFHGQFPLLLLICAVILGIPGYDWASSPPQKDVVSATTVVVPPCHGPRWIVNVGSLKHSQSDFPLELQKKFFDSPCTFLVTGPNLPQEYKNWSAIKTKTITSTMDLDAVVNDSTVQAVLYDPEAWEMTPPAEQKDPAGAACRLAPVVHARNKLLIVTPATNLVRFIGTSSFPPGQSFEAFAKTGIAGSMAKCADAYEIQGQGIEANTNRYRSYIEAIAKQARSANGHVVILAGISTNPWGQRVSSKDVFNAVQAVRNTVDGFWLNIPAGGKFCPTCGEPQPRVAVEMLQMLEP